MPSSSASRPNRPTPAAETAIGDGELAGLFQPLAGEAALALAVSGGPDSLALLILVDRWRRSLDAPPAILVLTVDHRLRPSSRAEAEAVVRIAADLGLPARILTWAAADRASEAAARDARYRLLIEAARSEGAGAIVLAHHRDDQAETFLMRLAAGSGPQGLAAMAEVTERDGVRLLRPFLAVPKARLAATVAASGLRPATDESNHDQRYLRPRLRRLMPALAEEGLGPERLARAAQRMRRVAEAIDHYAGRLLAEAAVSDALAVVTLAAGAFAAAPEEVRLRALERLLGAIGGGDYAPRSERLEALQGAMLEGGPFRRTLAGVTVERRGGGFRLYRETGRAGLPVVPVRPRFDGIWDRRFAITISAEAADTTLSALGSDGRIGLGIKGGGRPAAALEALPAVRIGSRVVAVPPLGIVPAPADNVTVVARCLLQNGFARKPYQPGTHSPWGSFDLI